MQPSPSSPAGRAAWGDSCGFDGGGGCAIGPGTHSQPQTGQRRGHSAWRGDAVDATLEPDAPIKPYRNGRDLTDISRDLQVIDCHGLSAEQVHQRFPRLYQWLLDHVKPERDVNRQKISTLAEQIDQHRKRVLGLLVQTSNQPLALTQQAQAATNAIANASLVSTSQSLAEPDVADAGGDFAKRSASEPPASASSGDEPTVLNVLNGLIPLNNPAKDLTLNLIAATALCHNLTVVTRNVKHFQPTGARVFDPFTAELAARLNRAGYRNPVVSKVTV